MKNYLLIFLLLALTLTSCASDRNTASQDDFIEFSECPSSPNCVSSLADTSDKQHYIDPYIVESENAYNALFQYLESRPDAEILNSREGEYIHAVFTTKIMKYKDDVEFGFSSGAEEFVLIDIKSSSRLGYSDLGKNRSRMEEIRSELGQIFR